MENNIKYLKSSLNDEIAYCHDDIGSEISIFFFGGYSSDMTGTKATALSKWCIENKYNFIRLPCKILPSTVGMDVHTVLRLKRL